MISRLIGSLLKLPRQGHPPAAAPASPSSGRASRQPAGSHAAAGAPRAEPQPQAARAMDLPDALLGVILQMLEPPDVHALSRTSRRLQRIVAERADWGPVLDLSPLFPCAESAAAFMRRAHAAATAGRPPADRRPPFAPVAELVLPAAAGPAAAPAALELAAWCPSLETLSLAADGASLRPAAALVQAAVQALPFSLRSVAVELGPCPSLRAAAAALCEAAGGVQTLLLRPPAGGCLPLSGDDLAATIQAAGRHGVRRLIVRGASPPPQDAPARLLVSARCDADCALCELDVQFDQCPGGVSFDLRDLRNLVFLSVSTHPVDDEACAAAPEPGSPGPHGMRRGSFGRARRDSFHEKAKAAPTAVPLIAAEEEPQGGTPPVDLCVSGPVDVSCASCPALAEVRVEGRLSLRPSAASDRVEIASCDALRSVHAPFAEVLLRPAGGRVQRRLEELSCRALAPASRALAFPRLRKGPASGGSAAPSRTTPVRRT